MHHAFLYIAIVAWLQHETLFTWFMGKVNTRQNCSFFFFELRCSRLESIYQKNLQLLEKLNKLGKGIVSVQEFSNGNCKNGNCIWPSWAWLVELYSKCNNALTYCTIDISHYTICPENAVWFLFIYCTLSEGLSSFLFSQACFSRARLKMQVFLSFLCVWAPNGRPGVPSRDRGNWG